MQINTQTFTGMVQQMAAAVQGRATAFIDVTVGSVLRALLESSATVALWLQWLILQVLASTRAVTCSGSDLDSWMRDFGFARLPGSCATGVATFSRFTPFQPALIPVGTTIMTSDGAQKFQVLSDAANSFWNGEKGYVLGAGVGAADLPVGALNPGSSGNIVAGSLTVITSPIPGIDSVTNTNGFSNGLDPETDGAFRSRFQPYINSRSLATVEAFEAVIAGVRQGLRFGVFPQEDGGSNFSPGAVRVVVDDGTGVANSTLLATVAAGLDSVRPVGVNVSVVGPEAVQVSIALTLSTASQGLHSQTCVLVQQAISSWAASLPMGGTLAVSKLDAIAHDASGDVVSVTSTLINDLPQDLTLPPGGVLLLAGIAVS